MNLLLWEYSLIFLKHLIPLNIIINKKLNHFGIRGNALHWFSNYLVDCTQYVLLNDINSTIFPIKCGVPQGSIMGPLLFILFISDIINISKLTKFIMFADDTHFFLTNLTKLYENVNIELTKIFKWFKINQLSLNIKKINFIIFINKYKHK